MNVLDHDGCRTGKTLSVTDGKFTLDGAKDKALYYAVFRSEAGDCYHEGTIGRRRPSGGIGTSRLAPADHL